MIGNPAKSFLMLLFLLAHLSTFFGIVDCPEVLEVYLEASNLIVFICALCFLYCTD